MNIPNDLIVAYNDFMKQLKSSENIYESEAYKNLANQLENMEPQELRVLIYEKIFDNILDASSN
jgi:hypothetical protein